MASDTNLQKHFDKTFSLHSLFLTSEVEFASYYKTSNAFSIYFSAED